MNHTNNAHGSKVFSGLDFCRMIAQRARNLFVDNYVRVNIFLYTDWNYDEEQTRDEYAELIPDNKNDLEFICVIHFGGNTREIKRNSYFENLNAVVLDGEAPLNNIESIVNTGIEDMDTQCRRTMSEAPIRNLVGLPIDFLEENEYFKEFFIYTLDYIKRNIGNDTTFSDINEAFDSNEDVQLIRQFNLRQRIEYDSINTAINFVSHIFTKLPEPVLSIIYFDKMSKVLLSNKSYVKVLPTLPSIDIIQLLNTLPATSLVVVNSLIHFMKDVVSTYPDNGLLRSSLIKWIALLLFGKNRLIEEQNESKAKDVIEFLLVCEDI